jgi:hypothetical protein
MSDALNRVLVPIPGAATARASLLGRCFGNSPREVPRESGLWESRGGDGFFVDVWGTVLSFRLVSDWKQP